MFEYYKKEIIVSIMKFLEDLKLELVIKEENCEDLFYVRVFIIDFEGF